MVNPEERLYVRVSEPAQVSDLFAWLQEAELEAAAIQNRGELGAAELAIIVGSGASVLRQALVIVQEWLRARRTRVEIRSGDTHISIDSSTNLVDIVETLRGHSESPDA